MVLLSKALMQYRQSQVWLRKEGFHWQVNCQPEQGMIVKVDNYRSDPNSRYVQMTVQGLAGVGTTQALSLSSAGVCQTPLVYQSHCRIAHCMSAASTILLSNFPMQNQSSIQIVISISSLDKVTVRSDARLSSVKQAYTHWLKQYISLQAESALTWWCRTSSPELFDWPNCM